MLVLLIVTGGVTAYGYHAGWERYIYYRQLPDRGRHTEQRLLKQLAGTPTEMPGASTTPPLTTSPSASPETAVTIDYMKLSDGRVDDKSIDSAMLGRRFGYRVYLPPGYDDPRFANQRYPVVYLLHGAPGGERDWVDGANANQTADALIKTRHIRPVIIIMPDGSLGDPHHDTQWGNSPVPGERVEDAIVQELVPAIDHSYRTIATRDARAIAGLSSGGYGSVNITLHHPETFAVAVSLSGYFRWQPTYDGKDLWGTDDVRRLNSPLGLVPILGPHPPLHIELIEGQDEGQAVDATRQFDQTLAAAGIDHDLQLYPGGHSWEFWGKHLLDALTYIDRHLETHSSPASGPSRTQSRGQG